MNTDTLVPLNIDTPEGVKLVLQVNESLERLEKNSDFQIFVNAYTQNFVLDKASLLATSQKQGLDRTILMELMIAASNFTDFILLLKALKDRVINAKKEERAEKQHKRKEQEPITPVEL